MRMIDTRGRWFELGMTSELRTGRLLWVDDAQGNDATGKPYDESRPYKTLAAASAAALAQDTVMVLPGNYSTTTSIAKAGVNWFFLPGSNVTANKVVVPDNPPVTLRTPLFDAGNLNSSAGYEFWVMGFGKFISNGAPIVRVGFGSSSGPVALVRFQCASMLNQEGSESVLVELNGNLFLDAPYGLATAAGYSGAALCSISGGALVSTVRTLSDGISFAPVVSVSGSGVFAFRGVRIEGKGPALSITSTSGQVLIVAEEVSSTQSDAITTSTTGTVNVSVTVSISNARILAKNATTAKMAISIGTRRTDDFRLTNCALGTGVASAVCIDAALADTNVKNYSTILCLNNSVAGTNIKTPLGEPFRSTGLPL